MSALDRLLPPQADNGFTGHRAALWLLGAYVALKLVMSSNSILNTADVAAGADGIPLDRFSPEAAREVLTLFALLSLGQLALALTALTVLLRYRALVPFITLMLLGEAIARRFIVQGYAVARADTSSAGFVINAALLALLVLTLALSLLPVKRQGPSTRPQ